jgi:hypothetical protein
MPIPFLSSIPIIGDIINKAGDIIGELIEDKDKANEIKAVLNKAFSEADLTKFETQINAQANIIIAEAKSASWLARNWRPGLMALFGIIIFNNYVLYPYLSLFFLAAPMLAIPAQMWSLLQLGVSGYVVGRSVEKGIELWKK